MKLDAALVEKVSTRTGKSYVCVEIFVTDKVKKTVFLTDSEVELIRLFYGSNKN